MTDLSKESWYHGRISRVDGEKILDSAGGSEGTYLVRDSLTITGEYVLSLCHQVTRSGGARPAAGPDCSTRPQYTRQSPVHALSPSLSGKEVPLHHFPAAGR